MKKLLSAVFVLLAVLLLGAGRADAAPAGFTPEIHRTFEGTPGELAIRDANGFDGGVANANLQPVYSSDVSWHGTTSAKVAIQKFPHPQADRKYFSWGGFFRTKGLVAHGGQYWCRILTYYPAGFSWRFDGTVQKPDGTVILPGEALKFMRLGLHKDGSNLGDWGFYQMYGGTDNKGMTVTCGIPAESIQKVFYARYPWQNSTPHHLNDELGPPIARGRCVNHEVYMKLDGNHNGVHRYYVDGQLVFEETGVNTSVAGAVVGDIRIFTYWNAGAPQDQHCYVGDFVFSTGTPPNAGSDGNPIIGDWIPNSRPTTPEGVGVRGVQ